MDGAILVVAANESVPRPQTTEHMLALDVLGIKQIVIVQNKVDLTEKEEALKNYEQIKDFVDKSVAKNAPIIPVSAQHNLNIDTLIEALENAPGGPRLLRPARPGGGRPRYRRVRAAAGAARRGRNGRPDVGAADRRA
jgi:translation initiation factor 2 subunit 3